MAIKYTPEELKFLKDSPLCTKPDNLPPAEEWMGSPVEQQSARTQNQTNRSANVGAFNMGHFEQSRSDKTLLDQTNRRPELNRHASRNSATNPEDIVFGPPRMSFTSAGRKGAESDRTREGEPQTRMNNFRSRTGEGDGDRFREGRNANPRRRDGGDDDKESWTTVKPRKSFGAEGAERFQGRMGIIRDDKRTSRETDRPSRGFDTFNREKDNEEDGRPRNGTRHKQEPSEGRIGGEKREQMDRAKSWREKVSNDDAGSSRQGGNHNNRQWGRDGRDGRAEREPEWLDEPADPKPQQPKTQGDFAKWKAEMHAAETAREARASGSTATKPVETAAEPAKPPMRSPPADVGNDKFFAAYGASASVSTPGEDTTSKPAVKSSRFQDFFATRNAPRNEPPPQAQPPPTQAPPPPGLNGLLGALQAAPSGNASQDEKQAFANIIAKLKVQSVSATPPGSTPFAAPPPSQPEGPPQTGSSPFQQMQSPQEGPMGPPPSQHPQELHAPRPQQQTARPDQLMQDLLGHHQRATSQSSGRNQGSRPDAGRNNSNSEFLMNLMRAPDAQRSDSAMKRAAQQAQRQGPMPPQPHEREGDFGEDGRNAQRMRGPPPGFGLDDRFRGEGDFRQPQPQGQPPHILQRPQGPPGLDQMPPGFMGGHMPLPQPQGQQPPRGGPMPPPGLQGGRGILPGMFPPGMPPPGPHMHPEMGNIPGPPRNMGMPPPGFFNGGPPPPGGPHGFMPPGMGGFNGPPGPESPFSAGPHSGGPHSGGPHSAGPFDRGMPQNRGGNFGRN